VEPRGLVFAFKEDTHPRMRSIGDEMINHKAIVFDSDFLNFTVRDGPISVKNKLRPQVNAIIELI
jgi:hypothetical protein